MDEDFIEINQAALEHNVGVIAAGNYAIIDTHSPATGEPIRLRVFGGKVLGEALVHFLVPSRRFWDDIGFT
jgi:hypothetical protein